MQTKTLQKLGLSKGESEIYLTLTKLGQSNIATLSKITKHHRTHIYDTLEKLKQKGLISETTIQNKKFVQPTSPKNILDYIKEKEELAKNLIEELNRITTSKPQLTVETYQGKSGLKSVLRDILRENKNYLGYGEGTRFGKILPIFYDQFKLQSQKQNLKLKLILKKGIKVNPRKGLQVKHLDSISPSTTFIYSNKIAIIIWEPFPVAIKMTEPQIAESYKNYFRVLWQIAE
jgi:sugar-specific transcriptional regulator TrmB